MRVRRDSGEAYREFAFLYDELLGHTAFEHWRHNFLRLSEKYGIRFDTAADVACGTGLAAEFLSLRCDIVYAVDGSRHMLEVARSRASAGKVVLMRQPFAELSLPEPVDLLTCNFDSLNYVRDESELKEVIRRFSRNLKAGGHALFDMNTSRELSGLDGAGVMVYELGGGTSIWRCSWDRERALGRVEMVNIVGPERGLHRMGREVHIERAYGPDLVLDLLSEAGFTGAVALDARNLYPAGNDARRVQFVARA